MIAAGEPAATVASLIAAVSMNSEPHRGLPVEGLPVVGAIVAAARNPADDRTTPLLLFSAGVQAIGILVAGVTVAELAERRHLLLDVGASPSGAGVSVTWRY